jgi:hypothetical protein
VTQDDDRASLSSVAKTSPGCRGLFHHCGGLANGCLHGPWEMYGLGPYVNQAWKVCDVLIGFSSVGCTSIRIITTLRYGYCLFVVVNT